MKVLVAMSGGVDSSVSAYLLKKKGFDVLGVTMCFGIKEVSCDKKKCCGAEAVNDAKRVCEKLDIAHYVLDFSKELEEIVIANFVSEYSKGRTPNPCVVCNKYLKFGSLLKKARALGADFFATGHYAKIEKTSSRRYLLKKPKDKLKDQTYFLYAINYDDLKNIIFPLQDYTKEDVRDIARSLHLSVADKAQSQDICFIPQGDYRKFIKDRLKYADRGDILDLNGNALGKHKGVFSYTVGQREGLGLNIGKSLYVISIDPFKNQIIVGEKKDLLFSAFVAADINILCDDFSGEIFAKIRYTQKQVLAEVKKVGHNKLKVSLQTKAEAITKGQSVVLYKDDTVLGGGIIEEVLR